MRVTVVIPFYNAKSTILDAIRSVYAQTYTDWEILLGDDGSTDGSLELVRSIADSRIRIITDGERLGTGGRLNVLHKLVNTEFVARLDADDMMHPHRLERQMHFFANNPETDVLGTGVIAIDELGHPNGKRYVDKTSVNLHEVLRYGLIATTSATGRTDWFANNPYDVLYKRGEDLELYCRTFENTKYANLRDLLVFYREVSAGYFPRYLASSRDFQKIYLKYALPGLGVRATVTLSALIWLKTAIYFVSTLPGLTRMIFRRRSLPLSEEERKEAERSIAHIRAQEIRFEESR